MFLSEQSEFIKRAESGRPPDHPLILISAGFRRDPDLIVTAVEAELAFTRFIGPSPLLSPGTNTGVSSPLRNFPHDNFKKNKIFKRFLGNISAKEFKISIRLDKRSGMSVLTLRDRIRKFRVDFPALPFFLGLTASMRFYQIAIGDRKSFSIS